MERSLLGGLPQPPPAKAQDTLQSPPCPAPASPPHRSHARVALPELNSRCDAILYPTHLLALCMWTWTHALQGRFVFLLPLKSQPVWKFPHASLMATSRTSPAARGALWAPDGPMCHFTDGFEAISALQQDGVSGMFSYLSTPRPGVG